MCVRAGTQARSRAHACGGAHIHKHTRNSKPDAPAFETAFLHLCLDAGYVPALCVCVCVGRCVCQGLPVNARAKERSHTCMSFSFCSFILESVDNVFEKTMYVSSNERAGKGRWRGTRARMLRNVPYSIIWGGEVKFAEECKHLDSRTENHPGSLQIFV